MEISIVILSCVILGLNPEMPVFIRLIMICNLNGFRQIKYIHTYIYIRYIHKCITVSTVPRDWAFGRLYNYNLTIL